MRAEGGDNTKSGIKVYSMVLDRALSRMPSGIKIGDRNAIGYIVTEDDIKTVFILCGFNVNRPAWKEIVGNWRSCGLLLLYAGGNYYITKAGLDLFNHGSRMQALEKARIDMEAQGIQCEVLA